MPKKSKRANIYSQLDNMSNQDEESGEDLYGDIYDRGGYIVQDYNTSSECQSLNSANSFIVSDRTISEDANAPPPLSPESSLDIDNILHPVSKRDRATSLTNQSLTDESLDIQLSSDANGDSSISSNDMDEQVIGADFKDEFNPGFDWTNRASHTHGKNKLTITKEWLKKEVSARVIKNRILNFLSNFKCKDHYYYIDAIQTMARENKCSFEVHYPHLIQVYDSIFAEWFLDCPEEMFALFNEVANFLVYKHLFVHYSSIHASIRVKIAGLPCVDPIRNFRQAHMGLLVRVEGVVTRRSPVYPELLVAYYDCTKCRGLIGPIYVKGRESKVSQCPHCHSRGPFQTNSARTEFSNYQCLVLQEPPSAVPPGRLPRSLEAVATGDNIDAAAPGETVDVTGVYRNTFDPALNGRQGFPVFATRLAVSSVARRCSRAGGGLSEAERAQVARLARHPNAAAKLAGSVAPSIHGRNDAKLALLLALLGGVPKDAAGDRAHRVRGDVHVLLLGDPGTAKSQLLKFAEKAAGRAVFATGRGSSAAGLTASVRRDAASGDFALEAGALVTADGGVCLIDEFDKMSDVDRTSIHEAMEQQTISVAKGGVVTTLSAKTTIIAAANPIAGHYDSSLGFDANVDLSPPILSRFDLLFVVKDEVNPELDAQLAKFICMSHTAAHPSNQANELKHSHEKDGELLEIQHQIENAPNAQTKLNLEKQYKEMLKERTLPGNQTVNAVIEDDDPTSPHPLPQSLLKKYIMHAKTCTPSLANLNTSPLISLYTDLRQESKHGGISITVRHMESILRLAEAHAKIYLKTFVTDADLSVAIALFLRSYLNTQKYSLKTSLERKFSRYLTADFQPQQVIHHKLSQFLSMTRSFERQLTGGIEPVTIDVNYSDFMAYIQSLNISNQAIQEYFKSKLFNTAYQKYTDDQGNITKIIHSNIK